MFHFSQKKFQTDPLKIHFDSLPSLEGILPNLLCFARERVWKAWWIRAAAEEFPGLVCQDHKGLSTCFQLR